MAVPLKGSEKATLVMLCLYADANGRSAFPGRQRLALISWTAAPFPSLRRYGCYWRFGFLPSGSGGSAS